MPLNLDVLRGKSPAMVRKEVWARLIVYNLIRAAMARAALEFDCPPRSLSFTGALQSLRAFAERLIDAHRSTARELLDWLTIAIAGHTVGDRPDRVEPRQRKRRPKHYPFLTQPRAQAQVALVA